jgi:hypothetical protein
VDSWKFAPYEEKSSVGTSRGHLTVPPRLALASESSFGMSVSGLT